LTALTISEYTEEAGISAGLEGCLSARSMRSSTCWAAMSTLPAASVRQCRSSLVLTEGNISASNDTASDCSCWTSTVSQLVSQLINHQSIKVALIADYFRVIQNKSS